MTCFADEIRATQLPIFRSEGSHPYAQFSLPPFPGHAFLISREALACCFLIDGRSLMSSELYILYQPFLHASRWITESLVCRSSARCVHRSTAEQICEHGYCISLDSANAVGTNACNYYALIWHCFAATPFSRWSYLRYGIFWNVAQPCLSYSHTYSQAQCNKGKFYRTTRENFTGKRAHH